LWQLAAQPSPILRLILLLGLAARARCISLARHSDQVEFSLHHADCGEALIPPSAEMVDELAKEVRRLAGWRERLADWWDRRRGCEVLSEREGTARLLLGRSGAFLRYWVLPYSGGVLLELALFPRPGAAESAKYAQLWNHVRP
jgi:hypothetical protein